MRKGHAQPDAAIAAGIDRYGAQRVALGHVLCDAHARDHEAVAMVSQGAEGLRRMTYVELRRISMRLAGALRDAGVQAGDRVAVMLPKSEELVIALVAIWRLGAVHVPLFTAFGPDAVGYRVAHSEASTVITDIAHRAMFDVDRPVFCVGPPDGRIPRGDRDFASALESGTAVEGVSRSGDDLFILLYTSGTTGPPKGVEVPVRALAAIESYMRFGLGLTADDVFWNMADPGWAYGLWYAVVGPLLLGQTTLLRDVRFDADDVFQAIVEHGVTNLAGAPTVYRSLRAAGVPADFRRRSRLRAISSAGEPLNANLLSWSAQELGVAIHDHYGQSELGMPVAFAQHPTLHRSPVPGSMGFASPGYRPVVLDERGEELGEGHEGELAIDTDASPLFWFRGYFRDPERTRERFRQGRRYYLTGDAARRGPDGLLEFASRADDVITSSGYRIGPFEVESALMLHEAVSEVAVIGTPDELRGEAVTAFVVPGRSAVASPQLVEELQRFVKSTLAAHLFPRRVVFLDELPRTPSGKVRRTALREQWTQQSTRTASVAGSPQ